MFNDLVLNVSGLPIHETQLQNVMVFAPNVNSIRRIKNRRNGMIFKKNKGGDCDITLAAPDANLYLVMHTLLKTKPVIENKLQMP